MRLFNDLTLRWKLLVTFGVVLAILGGAGAWTTAQLRQQDASWDALLDGESEGAQLAQEMRVDLLLQVQALKNTWLRGSDPKAFQQYTGEFDANANKLREARSQMASLSSSLTSDESALLQKFDTGWAAYLEAWPRALEAYGGAGGGKVKEADAVMKGKDRDAVASVEKLAQSLNVRREGIRAELEAGASKTAALTLGLMGLGVLLGLGIALWISTSIARRIKRVSRVAEAMAGGDIDQAIEMDFQDEIGDLANSCKHMTEYMDEIASVARAMAQGDLTSDVRPKSQGDVLGTAFASMISNLRHLISQVSQSVAEVHESSQQLAEAAVQVGAATQQISSSIQQVARGAQEQTTSISGASTSTCQLSQAIDEIARGAQEQAKEIERTSESVSRTARTIDRVASSSQSVAEAADLASSIAREGAAAVSNAVQAMESIRDTVTKTADKIRELGRRSEEIGNIVETIDDIAEQTNLLALNAAIEAARAGEHGKGFAVVADEVRKLAERASKATKEIASLIEAVQQDTGEAVRAMEEGVEEVEGGGKLTEEAGRALGEILGAVETTAAKVREIDVATQEVSQISAEAIQSMDTVSSVVEENTAATEQMAASSAEVMSAIEAVAAISEENSAAAEEVSAATEEVGAQVAQMEANVNGLASMVQALREVTREFRLSRSINVEEQLQVLETFKQAHMNWVRRCEAMIAGNEVIDPQKAISHTTCSLGKWYSGRGSIEWVHLPEFHAIDSPHQAFHQLVAGLAETCRRGDRERARAKLSEVKGASQVVVSRIEELARKIAASGGTGGTSSRVAQGQRSRVARRTAA